MNLSELNPTQVMEVLLLCNDMFKSKKLNSVRILVDVSKIQISMTSFSNLKKISKDNQKYIFKSAIIGFAPVFMPFLEPYKKYTNSKALYFKTKEEAINYLIEG